MRRDQQTILIESSDQKVFTHIAESRDLKPRKPYVELFLQYNRNCNPICVPEFK